MVNKTFVPALSIIVAVDSNGGFGKDGKIPWNIPEDMKHFKEVTSGGICIMGRNTYEDMLEMVKTRHHPVGSPPTIDPITDILPNRTSFVVTSNPKYVTEGATVVTGVRQAIESLDETDNREIFIIGGYRMFIEALSWTRTIYLSIIKGDSYDCNVSFPIDVINKKYKIVDAKETKNVYFVTYKHG